MHDLSRLSRPEFCRTEHVSGEEIAWHGDVPYQPDWSETSRFVAYSISNTDDSGIYIAFNSSHTARMVQLPVLEEKGWEIVVDTGVEAPFDMLLSDDALDQETATLAKSFKAPWIAQNLYPMFPHSCIVLIATPEKISIDEERLF